MEVFYKHRQFLLSRMLKREEDIPWTQTNIFEHLCEKFPVCIPVIAFVSGYQGSVSNCL